MRKSTLIVSMVVVLAAALCAYAGLSRTAEEKAGGERNGPAEKPVVIKTAVAAEGSVTPSLTVTGTLAGNKEIQLAAKGQGIITQLNVRAGDRVRAGQLVAVLESETQQLTAQKSTEQVTAAELNLEKAKIAFERADELFKQEAISQAEWENAKFMLESTQVAYNVALHDSQLADKMLKDTQIVAPFSGSVGACLVEKGQLIFPGDVLVTVIDDSSLKIKSHLNAEQLKLVCVGQRGVFTVDLYPGKEFPCTVESISTKANPANLTYAVELSLQAETGRQLRPGMFGYVRLQTAETKGTIIPREALITRDESGEATVFVVSGNKAFTRHIKTGENDEKNIIVNEGLKAGDKVVIFGQNLLKEGTEVTEGE